MPNHVHILISPKIPLSRITNGIKGVTSRSAKSILALQQKHFWQDESFDHWVRSPEQFDTIRAYIENNPVKAGLAAHPEDWPWSSVAQPLLAVQPPTPHYPAANSHIDDRT